MNATVALATLGLIVLLGLALVSSIIPLVTLGV